MVIKINFGAWNSVFAVPSALVDTHIKLATESQLKVLLYILRHSDAQNSVDSIATAISVHPEEVRNAVDFWSDRGLVLSDDSAPVDFTPPVSAPAPAKESQTTATSATTHKVTLTSRLQRPDITYVANRLSQDKELSDLLNDIEYALGKVLSAGDKATVVMIKETLGLPCEVINLLVNYCASNGKGNMRAVEKMAAKWSDKGIFTIEDADRMIEQLSLLNSSWYKVSKIFGIKNIGLPTEAQLSYADTWLNEWKFSEDMLHEAYERCVNSKGEYNIRYINGILKKWHHNKIFNLDTLAQFDAKAAKAKKKQKENERNASYDIETFESKSLFTD